MKDYRQTVSYYVGTTFSNVCALTLLKASENHSWKWWNHTDTTYASHISIGLPKIAGGFAPKSEAYDLLLNDNYH